MASDLKIRASDADRERTAAALREHLVAGRLTPEEFDERLDKAFAARTLGDLENLMADLPGADLRSRGAAELERTASEQRLPGWPQPGPMEARQGRLSPAWRAAWGSWLGITVLFLVIGLLSGTSGALWFLWIPAILGALMLRRWIIGAPPRRQPPRF
jgi:hypothetical protein